MPTRLARLSIFALLACSCITLAAPTPLPEGVTSRATLTDADRTSIRFWATEQAEALRSGEPAALTTARTDLIGALTRESSVAFRLEASSALSGVLSSLARGADEIRAFNALQVAGALATDAGAELLRAALGANKPTIRYGGALGSRILFQQFVAGRSPLTQEAITQQMRDLASALEREQDPVVAEGLMTAFGVQFSSESARATALRTMDDALVKRVGSLRESGDAEGRWARAIVRGVDLSRRLLLDQQVAGQRDAAFAKSASTLAGHGLAFAAARLNDEDTADHETIGDLLKASEVTLLLTSVQLGARDVGNEQPIAQAWDRNDSAAVRQGVDRWIGPNGLLYRAPFSLPSGSLAR